MKIASAKGLAVNGLIGAVAIGALFFAGNANAHAQGFAVGVQFGGPAYAAPAAAYYAAPGYYGVDARRDANVRHEVREAMARREAIIRQQEWERARDRRFDDRRFDRDDRRFDRGWR